jgi:hypothetical protein
MRDDDIRIDELIRRILERREADEPAEMHSDALHAYLTRKATSAQKGHVRRALSQSADARDEVVELAEYLEKLPTDVAAEAFRQADAPPFDASVFDFRKVTPTPQPALRDRVQATIRDVFTPRRVALASPLAALIVFAVVITPRMFSFAPMSAPNISRSVEPKIFALSSGRMRDRGSRQHDQAALRQFRQCLDNREGNIEVNLPELKAQEATIGEVATVHLVGPLRRKVGTIRVPSDPAFAEALGSGDATVQLWIAAVANRPGENVEIRSFSLGGGAATVRLPDDVAGGVWFVTYERNGRIHASNCTGWGHASR